jgi:hypothetical protein
VSFKSLISIKGRRLTPSHGFLEVVDEANSRQNGIIKMLLQLIAGLTSFRSCRHQTFEDKSE